jgi:hypothetical protein
LELSNLIPIGAVEWVGVWTLDRTSVIWMVRLVRMEVFGGELSPGMVTGSAMAEWWGLGKSG